ncbi:MAG: choice-of-anchor D domain-containing protein [bacterium]
MKLKYTILTLVLFFITANIVAQERTYVFFKDIDNVYNTEGTIISNGIDDGYWAPLNTNGFFTENLLKSGYDAFFASGKSLTNFEVAVFYMGNQPLQYSGVSSGRRIVTEIKNMLDIGKRVILIGNFLLYWAFDPGSNQRDPEVQQFFADYLGIDQNAYLGMLQTCTISGNSWTPKHFTIKAFDADEVTKGYPKRCNIAASENNVDPMFPWRSRPYIEAIDGTRLPETTIPCEFFTWKCDYPDIYVYEPTDTIIGVRVQKPSSNPAQDSKIMFWSTGFEVAAASTYMPYFMEELWYAMIWCTSDLPQPGPRLEFNVNPLEFGTIAVSDSLTKEVKITNKGTETLEIYDMYLDDPSYSGFTVETDELEVTLEPGEYVYVPIKFKPEAEEYLEDYFNVVSNAFEGDLLSIEVNGYGGKKPEAGPRLAVISNVLDFGTIAPNEKDTLDIEMINPGVAPLFIMQKFYWPRENQPPFMYATGYEWSITIQPGTDTIRRSIKFAPTGAVGTFYDTIGIVPYNAVNYKEDTLWIYLKGISRGGDTDAAITLTSTDLMIDSTELGQQSSSDFTIENMGTKLLYIYKLELEDNFGGVFKLLDKNDEDFSEQLPWALWLNGPQKKRKVKVEFTPKEAKTYNGKVLIELMDEMDNPITELNSEVSITAIAKDTAQGIGVVEEGTSQNGILSVKAIPNPITGASTLFFTINSFSEVNLQLYLVDLLGNKIKEFKTGRVSSGDYGIPFKTDDLSSGMYYIVGSANGDIVRLPLAVIK